MKNFLYKLKLLFLRVLCYEKPLRVAFIKYLSLKFSSFRPHYETLIYETSKNAIKLGFKEINIIELGVAGGNGVKSILKYKRKIEKILDIKINIIKVYAVIFNFFEIMLIFDIKNDIMITKDIGTINTELLQGKAKANDLLSKKY